jgi:hypothetical protein
VKSGFMSPWRNDLPFLLVLSFAFCPTVTKAQALTQQDLDVHRSLWESKQQGNYDFLLSIGCFCDPDSVRPGLINVRSGAITSVVDAQTFEPLNPANFLTIDDLFHRAQLELDRGALEIVAEFDSALGFPRLLRIDDVLIGDDDLTFRVHSLSVVPEPSSIYLASILLALMSHRKLRASPPR